MPFHRSVAGVITAILIGGCTSPPSPKAIEAAMRGDIEVAARTTIEAELQRQGIPTDTANVTLLLDALEALLRDTWGEEEPEVASQRRYVKYSGEYQARAIVDFDEGWLQVETIIGENQTQALRQAIINTLLTDRDMTIEDIFSGGEPHTGGEPFLFRQVLDADGEPIRWRWRAERFAEYLLANARTVRRENGRVIHSVRTNLVDNHQKLRKLEYAEFVLGAAQEYGVAPSLIYAVIEVESAFNPYAISTANAYGLMQVVPATAGRDVYSRIKGLGGQPTGEQLFEPEFNIDIGSAYLHLLDDVYLARIDHPDSRKYAMIAAYNGGAGSTLRAFARDRDQAIATINGMLPADVYARIRQQHPFGETRAYLEKVRLAERGYL